MQGQDMYSRTRMLIGDGVEKLKSARVLVCGVGGVGCYVIEALVRAGVGQVDVLDNDVFSESNLNRQLFATVQTVGRKKTEVAKERIQSINQNCKCNTYDLFYLPETADNVDLSAYDYVADAVDTVTAKIELIVNARHCGVPVITCMGTGNKLGTDFKVADIFKTSVCPLAKVMRKELRARDISDVKAVYSEQEPVLPQETIEENGRHIPASISYAPAIAGLVLASEIIKDLINN